MEENLIILKRSVKNSLDIGNSKSFFRYKVTKSGVIFNKKEYINTVIIIDQHEINVYTHKDYKRGYLQYYHYDSNETFNNGNIIKYDLYLPVDCVLDKIEFFTTTKLERREIKIQQLKEKLKKNVKIFGN